MCVKGRDDCVFITTKYTSATVNRADGYCSYESFELPALFRSALSVATLFFFSRSLQTGEKQEEASRGPVLQPSILSVTGVCDFLLFFSF